MKTNQNLPKKQQEYIDHVTNFQEKRRLNIWVELTVRPLTISGYIATISALDAGYRNANLLQEVFETSAEAITWITGEAWNLVKQMPL